MVRLTLPQKDAVMKCSGEFMHNNAVTEVAMLHIKPGLKQEFEVAFKQASPLIAAMKGYLDHQLHCCIETPEKYLLIVQWETLEDHTIGFRSSPQYQEWKVLLHHFYDPFPVVEHFKQINLSF